MELTCERTELFETLGTVLAAIPARSTHPVLANVLLTAEKGELSVLGTDMDVVLVGKIKANVTGGGALAVPAKRLFELLRELGAGEVTLKKDKDKLTVTQGRGRFTVAGVGKDYYPNENLLKDEIANFTISAEDLSRMIAFTSYSISADVARIALSGLYINILEKEIHTVATDGHRLAFFKKEAKVEGAVGQKILLPSKTVNHITKLVADAEGEVKVTLGKGTARFAFGKYTVTSKLITETFPDYAQVIPKDNTRALIADKEILTGTVKRSAVLSNPLTHLIKFTLEEGKAILSCSDYDIGGEAYEEIPVEYSDEGFSIGFNSNYLLEIMRHIDTEEVKILMKNPLSAALIVPLPQKEKEEYLAILMPLRLPEEEA
jgi:DNA polymerase III subunit beta